MRLSVEFNSKSTAGTSVVLYPMEDGPGDGTEFTMHSYMSLMIEEAYPLLVIQMISSFSAAAVPWLPFESLRIVSAMPG